MIKVLFLLGIIFLSSCNLTDRSTLPGSDQIFLTWELIGNNIEAGDYRALFVLENRDDLELGNRGWSIYFNQLDMSGTSGPVSGDVKIEHLNGDLVRISPEEDFRLAPGQSVNIEYTSPGKVNNVSGTPLGPYIVFQDSTSGGTQAFAIDHYTIHPFPGTDSLFPPETGIPVPDAAWVYHQNVDLEKVNHLRAGSIIPSPVKVMDGDGTVAIGPGVRIHYQEGLESETGFLAGLLESITGVKPVIEISDQKGQNIIQLYYSEIEHAKNQEGYLLRAIPGEGIVIGGGGPAGVFWGIQSLLSLLPIESWHKEPDQLEIEAVVLEDEPAFGYRGMMLDIARNYHSPETIKKMIRIMGFYKMNKLHLSLTNDEAWRLEIPSLPELTEVGGYRGHTLDSKDHLIPAYGSGPYPDPENGTGSGFLTREAFIDILKFAKLHHIEVIPEINFPGHSRAAIYAMEARYDRLMAEGDPEEAEKYRLIDPSDRSRYRSAQNFHDNVVCVCKESVYLFYETVVDEVMEMYRDAGMQLKVIHSGGDEVPGGVWTGSPICEEFLKGNPEVGEAKDLQAWFEGRLLEILSRKNLVMAGWEEVALVKDEQDVWIPNPEYAGKGIVPYVWNNQDEFIDLGNRVANAGYPVVLCSVDNFYFDLAYTHHPDEPGHWWGGYANTRRAFEFIPYNVFHSTLTDKYRRPYGPEKVFTGYESLKPEARKNILGLQGHLWSETIKGGEMLEYYYLPKMLGLAERAWAGQADWGEIPETTTRVRAINQSWNEFANIIGQREMLRLDYMFDGFNYRLPPPGGVIREGVLYANTDFPGMVIRYTMDGSEPQVDSPLYTGPVEVSGAVNLASFDTRNRSSRVSKAVYH